jgi:hypothetical protein
MKFILRPFLLKLLILICVCLGGYAAFADIGPDVAISASKNYLVLEGGALWQSKNDQRIPGNSGSLFSLSDFSEGPFGSYRIYWGRRFSDRHEVRLLYAPLKLELSGKFPSSVNFKGTEFAANTETKVYYKFNSYRISYIYHLEKFGAWESAFGFTGKIRDAEVRLTQGALQEGTSNVGFVPLLHFQAHRRLSEKWKFIFDMDGLAAPQGRAIDLALLFERRISKSGQNHAYFGYRTIEGGADNDKVYNIAWIHIATLGLKINY